MRFPLVKEIFLIRRKVWSVVALLILVNIGFALYMAYVQQPRVDSLRADWLAKRDENGLHGQVLNQAEVYKKGLEDLKTLNNRIYQKHDFARFLGEIFDEAKKNSLSVTSVTYKPTVVQGERLLSYDITLSVSGKYPAIKRFLYDLRSSSNLVVIESIALSSKASAEESVQLQVQLSSFFRVEGQ